MAKCEFKNKKRECTKPFLKCKHMKVVEIGGDSFHSYEELEYRCVRPNTSAFKENQKKDHCTHPE